jgi:hypothetical protein
MDEKASRPHESTPHIRGEVLILYNFGLIQFWIECWARQMEPHYAKDLHSMPSFKEGGDRKFAAKNF